MEPILWAIVGTFSLFGILSTGGYLYRHAIRKALPLAPKHLELEAHYDAVTGSLLIEGEGTKELPPGTVIKLLGPGGTPYRGGGGFEQIGPATRPRGRLLGQARPGWSETREQPLPDVPPESHAERADRAARERADRAAGETEGERHQRLARILFSGNSDRE